MGKTEEKDNPFGLTDKQIAFCNYYLGLIDGSEKETMFNLTKSAIAAGYSEKSARFIASENLTKPNISRHLTYLRARIVKFQRRSPEALKSELENISVANVTDLLEVKGGLIKIGMTKGKKPEPIYEFQQRIMLKNSEEWGELSAAIQEISETKDGRIRIKLHPKTSAIETLMRLHDQFPKRTIKLPSAPEGDAGGTGGSNYIFFLPEEGVELIPPDKQPKIEVKKQTADKLEIPNSDNLENSKDDPTELIKQAISKNKKKG